MNDNWLVKYESKNLENFINNQAIIKEIENSLCNEKGIIIKGNCGIGKNNILKLLAKKLNYELYNYKLNDKKEINLTTIYNKLLNLKKPKILILNKIDYITTNLEKKNIQNLNKLHLSSQTENFKLVYLIEKDITKTIKELAKNLKLYNLKDPNDFILKNIVENICEKEDIILDKNIIQDIINSCQKDVRKLILILKDLKYTFNEKITINKYLKYKEYTNEKIKNYNVIETTKKVLNNYNNLNNFNFYNTEKVILPLMLYENYLEKFKLSSKKKDILNYIIKISNFISKGDIIETNIYTDQNWYLQNIHGFYTCLNTSYWINKNNDKQLYKNEIKFSSDLNKTSLRNINKKNINNLLKIIPKKSINEISFLNKICNNLLISNREKEIFDILKSYLKDFDIKDFELFLKIDKTSHLVGLIKENKNKKKINNLLKSNI